MPDDGRDEIIKEFLAESHENLERMDQELVALEKDPESKELVASIFRTLHTLKGNSGLLGFAKLGAVAHAGESLLAKLRDGGLKLNPEITTVLLQTLDTVRKILVTVQSTGKEGNPDCAGLLEALARAQKPQAAAPAPRTPAQPAPAPAAAPSPPTTPPSEPGAPVFQDNRIHIDVKLLDKLMSQVSELVLARNQMLQLASTRKDAAVVAALHRLNLAMLELQDNVMKARLQPIETVWNKVPRLARDLALACNKQVRVEMEGKETELDRALLEVLKDPLTHLIRNAIDHGIEDPETRLSRGKLPEGRIVLKAFHEGGHVIMEIQDDGGGIHLGRIRRKAVEGGYLSLDQATQAKEMDLINLIFMPGFSTREQATDLSGRGVGMDVVKTNIEKMGGTIEVFNKEGYGVRFRIRIPLTLAIVQALIVACGGRRYAVPQINLVEVLRVSTRAIESVHGAPVFRLRGQLLPIVHLHDALQVESGRNGSGSVDVVVLQADERRFGLAVDHVENTLEIVVKSLNRPLGRVPCFTAATILGDGEVVLILDVHGLAARSNVLAPAKDRVFLESETPSERPAGVPTLLLCQVRDDGRVAIPLSRVVRLEEFPRTRLERMGVHHVVQYRGHILPVAHVSSLLPERRQKPRQSETAAGVVRVVVIRTDDGRAIGLGVEKILDAVEQPGPLQRPSGRPGTLGCIVLQGRVTEVLDLARLTQLIDEAFAGVVKTP